MPASRSVELSVVSGDILTYPADIVVLKHAQGLYGADAAAYTRLQEMGVSVELPIERDWRAFHTKGSLATPLVLFIGVEPLQYLGYPQIREFARTAISAVADAAPEAHEIALTIHGPGYGLDAAEAFEFELAGVLDGLKTGRVPSALRRITFVERSDRRAADLGKQLAKLLPGKSILLDKRGRPRLSGAKPDALVRTGGKPGAKPRVFVAMPFRKEMEDFFEFGILRPAKKAGFICERADKEWFTDDIVAWVKERIATADIVLADLTGANPNVYLEVGYAWGQGRRTLLLAQSPDDLKFDVKTQKCVVYTSIKELEHQVKLALKSLI